MTEDFENELRRRLAPVDAPEGFAERVMRALPADVKPAVITVTAHAATFLDAAVRHADRTRRLAAGRGDAGSLFGRAARAARRTAKDSKPAANSCRRCASPATSSISPIKPFRARRRRTLRRIVHERPSRIHPRCAASGRTRVRGIEGTVESAGVRRARRQGQRNGDRDVRCEDAGLRGGLAQQRGSRAGDGQETRHLAHGSLRAPLHLRHRLCVSQSATSRACAVS